MRPLSRWNRRRFLQAAGIGASAAALAPFVPISSATAGGAAPRRLVLFTLPMGSVFTEWRRNGAGTAFATGTALPPLRGRVLAPLDGLQSRLAIVDGLDIEAAYLPVETRPRYLTGGHHAMPCVWTGRMPVPTAPVPPPGPGDAATDTYQLGSAGPSIDRVYHEHQLAGARHLSAYQLGCWAPLAPSHYDARACSSYDTPSSGDLATPLFPVWNPRTVFDAMFSAVGTGGGSDRRMRERQSVLSVVRGEMSRLRAELPAEDRDRLDRHHQSIVDLEARLGGSGPTCAAPEPPRSYSDRDTRADPREVARIMHRMVRLAFECDLARSVSFMCGTEVHLGNPRAWDPSLPVGSTPSTSLHAISHEQHVASNRDVMLAYNRSMVESLGELARELQSGNNSLSDTLIVAGGPMSDSDVHVSRNPMFMLIAGENIGVVTNRYFRFGSWRSSDGDRANGGIPHNRLLTTVAQALGMSSVTSFGDPRIASAPIDALLA